MLPDISWPAGLIPLAEAGARLLKSPRTLKRMFQKGTGPAITYIGRTPYIRERTLEQWILD